MQNRGDHVQEKSEHTTTYDIASWTAERQRQHPSVRQYWPANNRVDSCVPRLCNCHIPAAFVRTNTRGVWKGMSVREYVVATGSECGDLPVLP